MKIAFGSDHAGYTMKEALKKHVEGMGYECVDYGCFSAERANYPEYGEKAARAVASGECDLGILVCGTGCGISLSANRVKGIRCCNCSEPYTAMLSRMHNNANMVAVGSRVIGEGLACLIAESFLKAEFEGGRHAERVAMIEAIDKN
ncbi:MAG: ribose 5-phosphate isomerase B [Clostridia bacterium]|nr:ribose 5-phosphate isomerase B [Clostridia bacterium]